MTAYSPHTKRFRLLPNLLASIILIGVIAFFQPLENGFFGTSARGQSVSTESAAATGATAPLVKSAFQSCTFRVAWTGPAHTWRGQIEIVNPSNPTAPGAITNAYSMGLESDQAAAYSLRQGVIYIHHPNPREYDGYNISAVGQTGYKLRITLCADNQTPQTFDIKWEDLFHQAFQFQIGDAKATVRRTPSDYLRLTLNRDNLVFSPSETFTGKLTPYQLAQDGLSSYNPATIRVQLQHSRERFEVYQKEYSWNPETGGDIPLSIPLPQEEGVYDIIITASCSKVSSLLPRVSGAVNKQLENVRLQSARELAQRKIQLTVIDPVNAPAEQAGAMETKLTAEIDPANSRWWETFERLSQFPLGLRGKQWEYPLGNGNTRVTQCELGPVTELAANCPDSEPCWEAYAFPVERPGVPHILEIEYPSNSEQTTGVSIIEPDANGAITPGNLDSGFHVSADALYASGKTVWKTHKMVFWPKTKSPVVVVYNLREDAVSRFGKIRVMAVAGKLPRAYSMPSPRLVAAYLDRPLFPEMFSAKMALCENSSMLLDDWETFYDSAARMIEYLNYVGYNGAMISVNCDGAAIWPCLELAPTPRYDTGVFAPQGNDPVRKDVLELLLRMFDRQKMRFIPAMEFTQPIPKLEALVRSSDPKLSGMQWIGPDGKTILDAFPPEKGAGMYYNILNPAVQKEVLDAVSHLTTRYKHHASFSGLSMQLSDNSWLILPPPQWGMDDETIRRFASETGIAVPGEGDSRFAVRAGYLNGPAQSAWLKWRSEKLTDFYCRMRDCIQSDGTARRLYLSGAKLFTRCHRNALLPRVEQNIGVEQALLQCGLEKNYGLDSAHDIVLLYTQQVINGQTLKESSAQRQWAILPDTAAFFDSRNGARIQASLFYHPSRQVRLTEFEKKSPYKPAFAQLNCVPTPANFENRRRFAQSMSLWDTQEFFDGGWTLALGEEDALANAIASFRCLARRTYQNAQAPQTSSPSMTSIQTETNENNSQAIACRWVSDGQSTWLYAINTTPFRITGKIKLTPVSADSGYNSVPHPAIGLDNVLRRFAELNNKGASCTENAPQLMYENNVPVITSPFAPFEAQVVRINTTVLPQRPTVIWEAQTLAQMRKQIYDLAGRAEALKTAKPLKILENPDFELPVDGKFPVPQWYVWKNPNQPETSQTNAAIDYRYASSGRNSLHLVSDGWPAAVYSKNIIADSTGRFTVSVWIKKNQDVPLRCFMRAKCGNKHVYRDMLIQNETAQSASAIEGEWKLFCFHVNDLPLEKMGDICIGFELSKPGEAWIDNVSISDLYFPENEQRALYKTLVPLGAKFAQGELEYCWKFQQGYWPQFLMDRVELSNQRTATGGITAPVSGAIGNSAQNAVNAAQQPTASQPTELSPSGAKKPLFGLGLGRTVKPEITEPTPPITAAPPAPPQEEKKTLWQKATGWLSWD